MQIDSDTSINSDVVQISRKICSVYCSSEYVVLHLIHAESEPAGWSQNALHKWQLSGLTAKLLTCKSNRIQINFYVERQEINCVRHRLNIVSSSTFHAPKRKRFQIFCVKRLSCWTLYVKGAEILNGESLKEKEMETWIVKAVYPKMKSHSEKNWNLKYWKN